MDGFDDRHTPAYEITQYTKGAAFWPVVTVADMLRLSRPQPGVQRTGVWLLRVLAEMSPEERKAAKAILLQDEPPKIQIPKAPPRPSRKGFWRG